MLFVRVTILCCVLTLFIPPSIGGGYPKINLAIGYEVDPDWPDRPDDIKWRYMTGVAVDSQDR
ncbi:MAG: hypothetical protein KC917_21700, partial [Candidatus Omnitrophica bacterium]|nr:hypothetical protein [Candidatus Omnitrophota bacterium]